MARAAVLVVVTVLVAVPAGCAGVGDPVHVVREARLWLGARDRPPPDDDPGWILAQLPDAWGVDRRLHATQGWYRAHVTLAEAPVEPWAVFLPRATTTSGVRVNGRVVGDGGGFDEPLPRNGNRPMLYGVPPALLRAGDNVVDVRLAMGASHPGLLDAFEVGPLRVLEPRHARWTFLCRTLVQGLTLAAVGLGVLIAAVFWRRDRLGAYRWIVAGVACWTLSSVDVFLVRSPLPSRAWDWIAMTGQATFVLCAVVGFHRVLEVRPHRLEAALAALVAGFVLAHALVPAPYAFRVNLASGMVTLAMGVYVIVLLRRAGRVGAMARVARLAPAGVLALAFGVHDVASVLAGRLLLVGVPLTPYIPAMILVVGFWNVLAHLADALTEAESLNRELEGRVAEKAVALERQHQRLRELERERAVTAERERIMQDVHDGMGGQLVSTLALVESGRFTAEGLADALRAALDDLRLVIDSLDPVEEDLLAVLATVRARLEPRLARHGIRIEWRVRDLPALPGFGPERVLQALRIVQEAVTNVLKHAHATTIEVRTGEAAADGGVPGVFVEIADDGVGLRTPPAAGRGLANMVRRAESLGGTLSVTSGGSGTVVRLWLPRAVASAAA